MKRNFKYNQHGGVDCEILIGHVAEVPAQDEILDDEGNIIQHAQAHIPEVAGEWHPHTCETIPDGVEIAPYVPPSKTKEGLLGELAAYRYGLETGGIVFNGVPVSTQRADMDGYYKILKSLEEGWIQSTPLTKGDVSFDVDLVAIRALLAAVTQHVDRVFKSSDVHLKKIAKLKKQAEIDSYDITQGWN